MQELDSYSMNIVVTAAAVVGVQHNWSSRAQQDEAMHNSTQYFATSSNERHCLLDQIMNHKEDGGRDRRGTKMSRRHIFSSPRCEPLTKKFTSAGQQTHLQLTLAICITNKLMLVETKETKRSTLRSIKSGRNLISPLHRSPLRHVRVSVGLVYHWG